MLLVWRGNNNVFSYLASTMEISRKNEIITTASRLFKEKGYNAVTMRDIAKDIKIKASSLYNHINSKQEILSDIILEIAQQFTYGMDELMNEETTALLKIEKIIILHIEITVNNPEGLAVLNNDWMHLSDGNLDTYIKMRDNYEDNFRKIIKYGVENGELKNNHPEVILFSILSTLRTLNLWYQKRGKLDINILKKDMVSVLIKGIL